MSLYLKLKLKVFPWHRARFAKKSKLYFPLGTVRDTSVKVAMESVSILSFKYSFLILSQSFLIFSLDVFESLFLPL